MGQSGRIIAKIDDYEVVRNLVYDLIAETTAPQIIRETVRAVGELGDKPNYAQVGKKLGIGKSRGKEDCHLFQKWE